MADEQLSAEATALKSEGNELLKHGDVRGAVDKYTEALALAPDSAVLYSNRSAALARMGDAAGALADAEKCVTLAPRWGKAYSRLAVALKDAGRAEDAAAATEQGLALEPDNPQLKAMRHRITTGKVCEALRGRWHGTVSEEVGGYVQEFDFASDAEVKVMVLGTTVDAKYALDVSASPHPHLDLSVPSADGSPVVRHIYQLDGDVLHLCSPYMAPPDDRPTAFGGPGYVKMVRGERKLSPEEVAKRARVGRLSGEERVTSFLREVAAAVPAADTRPTPQDTETSMATKMAANVKFQAAYQALIEQYGAEVELLVKELVVGVRPVSEQPAAVQKGVAEFRDKMMFAGLIPRPGEMEEMEAAQREHERQERKLQQQQQHGSGAPPAVEEVEDDASAPVAASGEDDVAEKLDALLSGASAARAPAPAASAARGSAPAAAAAAAAAEPSGSGWQTALVMVGLGAAVVAAAAVYLLSRSTSSSSSSKPSPAVPRVPNPLGVPGMAARTAALAGTTSRRA